MNSSDANQSFGHGLNTAPGKGLLDNHAMELSMRRHVIDFKRTLI